MIEADRLKVYSEDHFLQGHIIEKYSLSEAKEIKVKIKENGSNSDKGFFYAIVPLNGQKKMDGVNVVEIKINSKKIQPIDSW